MRIVHLVLGKANPERMNGINKVVDSLATEQTTLGHEVTVWGITPTPNEKTTARPYKLVLLPSSRNKLRLDSSINKTLLNEPQDTIFHMHGGFITEFYHLAQLLKDQKRSFIFTPHGNYAANAMRKNWLFKKIYFKWFEKKILHYCKAIHCLGSGESDDIQKLTTLKNKVVIPNGQHLKDVLVKGTIDRKRNIPIFGFCGRITRNQKGLDLLLEGFNQYIYRDKGQGQLWIIGSGDYLLEMKQLAHEHILNDRIIFWGPQFSYEKFNLIATMDAFYHTSRNEGLPTAILEASAAGIPCVVSKHTNMGEYITQYQAGILLEKNTPDEIASSMNHIAACKSNGSLEDMGKRASLMVEKEFNWRTIAQQLTETYQQP